MAAEAVGATELASTGRDGVHQYYLAVDRVQFKLQTLVDLLKVLSRRAGLPVAICVGPRDSLDEVYAAVADCDKFSPGFLYSDLSDEERAKALETFQLAMTEWNFNRIEQTEEDKELEAEARSIRSQVLVMTDVCLPSASLGESPLHARIAINYDLPAKKEAYTRRLAACFGGPGLLINLITAGDVSSLRNIEEKCGLFIDEMPMNISELV